jgi:site-specific recombinase
MNENEVLAQVRAGFAPERAAHAGLADLAGRIGALVRADELHARIDAWLRVVRWIRGGALWRDVYIDSTGVHGPATQRLAVLLDVLERNPPMRQAFQRAIGEILAETEAVGLFGEVGIPSDRGFIAELSDRLVERLIPQPRDDHDLASLLRRQYRSLAEADRLGAMPAALFRRMVSIMFAPHDAQFWGAVRRAFGDGLRLLAARVQGQGLAEKLRRRSRPGAIASSPFHRLPRLIDTLLAIGPALEAQAAHDVRDCVAACRAEMAEVERRIESDGVSVDIVYGLEVLDICLGRIAAMVDLLTAEADQAAVPLQRLLAELCRSVVRDRSLRNLARTNLQLLQRKIVERAGKTGEHYIAGSLAEYRHIWLAAAGGGLLTTLTGAIKLVATHSGFAPFVEGLAAGLNYAISFLLLQAFGLMLATKQPAMTAATLASIIRERRGGARLDEIVDVSARICSSQLAATISNVVVVAFGAYLFSLLWQLAFGRPYLDAETARHVVDSLSPVDSGTVFYAALTGVILYLASLVGGWLDNWAVYHRLPQALAEHRLGRRFGRERMVRLSGIVSRNIAGWGTNVSLGFMLGMTPVIGHFLGLPLDVRHVTLNSGILTLATASLDDFDWTRSFFLLAVSGVAVMFVLNLGVSFVCALLTAARAYELPRGEMAELGRRLVRRLLSRPGDFLLPRRLGPQA